MKFGGTVIHWDLDLSNIGGTSFFKPNFTFWNICQKSLQNVTIDAKMGGNSQWCYKRAHEHLWGLFKVGTLHCTQIFVSKISIFVDKFHFVFAKVYWCLHQNFSFLEYFQKILSLFQHFSYRAIWSTGGGYFCVLPFFDDFFTKILFLKFQTSARRPNYIHR